jgi:heterotetrameric sarcosine oxidase gamma subunit
VAEPAFRSPIRGNATVGGTGVTLEDETGLTLTRRFGNDVAPGTARRVGSTLEWSVSPGEWTVAGSHGDHDARAVDLTHVRAVFRIGGHRATDVLAMICPLDLSDDMFPDGAAARTLVAGMATELVRDTADGSPSYLVVVSRSFALHLWEVMRNADPDGGHV